MTTGATIIKQQADENRINFENVFLFWAVAFSYLYISLTAGGKAALVTSFSRYKSIVTRKMSENCHILKIFKKVVDKAEILLYN